MEKEIATALLVLIGICLGLALLPIFIAILAMITCAFVIILPIIVGILIYIVFDISLWVIVPISIIVEIFWLVMINNS